MRLHRTGAKRIHHPDVGDLEFTYEGLEVPGSPGWMFSASTAAAGSPASVDLELAVDETAALEEHYRVRAAGGF